MPAALVAAVLLVLCGFLLVDVISVRTGHVAARWRVRVATEAATRHLDDLWVLIGAGAAVLIGGWLCWLALAPGRHRWLAMRGAPGGTVAVIDRAGLGVLLVARAGALPGVEHSTVRIRKHRIAVRIIGPADPAAVQRQLRTELDRVALAAPPRLDVMTGRGRGSAR
ncbi:DUF6286 domain-containing protein [Kitasatospora sp. NPDC050543]|uniref:DUF6286 domain-containing protein n=1 Tax=Kitasatospora sp. NPDC050543 TaxID=3364054 RepID=UPI003793816C